MILYNKTLNELIEESYQIKNEAQHSSLFTTGNGYFGVRGSFEEFGSLNVQGSYVRGLIDEIIEIPNIFVDNIYMRKYYFDELKAKKFEYQDSCINYCDFLFVRFIIGDKEFYPWEGNIVNWVRYIDTVDGSLIREVLWDDGDGNLSKLVFKRFASFSNNHQYLIKCSLEKVNHNLPCKILSGVDTFVKTNGQKASKLINKNINKKYSQLMFNIGSLYNFDVCVSVINKFSNASNIIQVYKDGIYFDQAEFNDSKIIEVEKFIFVNSTIDYENEVDLMEIGQMNILDMEKVGYNNLYKDHIKIYSETFDVVNIKIYGNEADDALLRYSNYQTIIGADRFDHVHSFSAKNLTAEKYNQFVWWDAEIFQLPIYLATNPKAAKNSLIYRYNRLDESRKAAEKLGLKGAKFAFCSSVKGDEKVWEYARHPFHQIHINADIAYGVINYYKHTMDKEFMMEYGFELLVEISRYWISRVVYNNIDLRYEILNVTGTDEHHPYIDNNAYTNYETSYILRETYRLIIEFNVKEYVNITQEELDSFNLVGSKIYLPILDSGLIPQFDGYLDLSRDLIVDGKGVGKGFQMKESGLYHLSQIIKQPDVMMLFSYLNMANFKADYKLNWEYYENLCEKSSSLTYPVHAICAIDNNEYEKFYEYWQQSMRIDIDDLHNGAHQGLHAACMAGGYYAIYRGLFGIKSDYEYLIINPRKLTFCEKIILKFFHHNQLFEVSLTNTELVINSKSSSVLLFNNEIISHTGNTVIKL